MKILVDADACPVRRLVTDAARARGIEVVMVCDTAHLLEDADARVVTVDKGRDRVDFALLSLLAPGDLVVTQDYGLAAMVLAKGGAALNQNGMRYDASNIEGLLAFRHISAKIRRGGGRTKGPSARRPADDEAFRRTLAAMLDAHPCACEE